MNFSLSIFSHLLPYNTIPDTFLLLKFKKMRAFLVLCTVLIGQSAGQRLTCDVPWLMSGDDYMAGEAVLLALNDLRKDWHGVLGCRPALKVQNASQMPNYTQASNEVTSVVLSTSYADSVLTPFLDTIDKRCVTGVESHCILSAADPWFGGTTLIVTASDPRGFLFALYAFSDVVLGIGPLDYWLGIDYELAASVDISTRPLPGLFSNPTFEYRAVFPNDEDLFGGLANDPLGHSVWSASVWDVFYATCFRLKVNTVLPGTNSFPDDAGYVLAARRGLVVTSHHYNILGTSPVAQMVAYWFPEPYNYQERPDAMMFAWEAAVKAQADYEALFTVGLRGEGDRTAECTGPCTVDDRAAHAQWAIVNQTQMVRKHRSDPLFLAWLWSEGLSFLESGILKVPDNTTLVFTDGGDSHVRGLEYATNGAGIYTHVAMLDGQANQLTEMVPPSRIFGSMTNFVAKKATKIFILNVSDLVPYLMTTLAYFRAAWAQERTCNSTLPPQCDTQQTEYLTEYAGTTFRLDSADATRVATAYNTYFNTSFLKNGRGDQYIANLISHTASAVAAGNTTPPSYDFVSERTNLCGAYQDMLSVLSRVPAGRQDAFKATVLNSIGYHCEGVDAVVNLLNAVNTSKTDPGATVASFEGALASLWRINVLQRGAEGARFRGLYGYDALTCLPNARREVLSCLDSYLAAQSNPQLPQNSTHWAYHGNLYGCRGYSGMYAFEKQWQNNNFPTQRGNASVNMFRWPQAYCVYANGSTVHAGRRTDNGDWCKPTPTGGAFSGSADVVLRTSLSQFPVEYSQNGAAPVTCNPNCTVTITETTTFSVWSAESDYPGNTTMTFTQMQGDQKLSSRG